MVSASVLVLEEFEMPLTRPLNQLIGGHQSRCDILSTHHHHPWNATLHVLSYLLKSHIHGLKYKKNT